MNLRLAAICLALLISASILFAGVGGVHAFQGEPDGYNGIPWGTPLKGLASMEYAGRQKDGADTPLYRRAGEDLTFGRARLTAVEYGFTNGLLSVVILRVNSLLQYLLMKEEAVRRFGQGKEVDPYSERYNWDGERTTVRLTSAFDMS